MKKKLGMGLAIILTSVIVGLFVYPHITIQTEDKLIACRYSDDISEFESEMSLDERYTYYADRDVTWTGFDFKKFGPFYILFFDITEGNLLETEYMMEPAYIQDFLENAVITENPNHVDVGALIEGKTPVVSNTRYICPDDMETASIYYNLHDSSNVMFIFEVDDLLVIQVGYPDEGPMYIAYQ